uniref:C-type lectin domain-containing protein n=1 Tax=Leptobrachium leishanense TaxID=445787 RepID=A0A8C5QP59_9ANUR
MADIVSGSPPAPYSHGTSSDWNTSAASLSGSFTAITLTSLTSDTALHRTASASSVSFYLVLNPMTWTESQSYCRHHHSDLAAISIPEEQSLMSSLLSGQVLGVGFWFGLRRSQFWGHWYWSGGQDFGDYTNWGPGEPQKPLSKMCGLISRNLASNLSWSVECCGTRLPFLCYKTE